MTDLDLGRVGVWSHLDTLNAASPDAFADMVGRYREVGVNEFIIDQPRDEQVPMLEKIAADLLPTLRAQAGRGLRFRRGVGRKVQRVGRHPPRP